MHTTIGIDIAAPPELVFRLAHDVTRWEWLLPHYIRSRARTREPGEVVVCDFVARRPLIALLGLGIPVAWRSRTWNEPATRRLHFIHVAGATRGMDVTWTIERAERGTRVEIGHDFRPRIQAFAWAVDRFFTRPIAGLTLATFKALAEALAADTQPDGTSATRPATNPSP